MNKAAEKILDSRQHHGLRCISVGKGYALRGPWVVWPCRPILFLACFVFLLYVDESGDPPNVDERYFVLGGVAVFERQAYWLNEQLDKLQEQYFPGEYVEFHARAIHSHDEPPWSTIPSRLRREILEALYRCIAECHQSVVLFGVALEKLPRGGSDPIGRAFEELCKRFDIFLRRLHNKGDTQRGLIIFDETRYESRLQTLLGQYRRAGTRFGRVMNFADVPLFADSKATRLLQVADLIAYAVFRRYERGDTQYLDKIVTRFHTEDDILHGLVHLTTQANCVCPACATRRRASAQA